MELIKREGDDGRVQAKFGGERGWTDGRYSLNRELAAPRRQPLSPQRRWARGLLCRILGRQSALESRPHRALADATATDKRGEGIQ